MGFDNKYPYTDFHEINLDWLLEKVKGIDDRFTSIEETVAALREDLDIQTGRIDAALDAITFIRNHYPAMIASEYDESRQYDPGEIAIYDNELYICLPGETPGPWNGNFWNKTSLGDELGNIIIKVNDIILPDLTNINNVLAEYGTLFDDIVETYDPNFTYFKNNFVKYEDHIYMVMVDSTTNPPTDTADWDPVTFANVFSYYINNLNVFVPEFQDNVPYRQYDYVRYNNYVYYLKVATFTGPWDPTKWENCVFSQEEAFHTRAFYDMFGTLYGWYKSFDDADIYNKGDVVNYNGTLYECIADNVTGAWDASKWQVQKVTDAMTDINTYYKNFPVKTAYGNPIEVTDAVAVPADVAIVSFLPVQEGSGDPSPSNPRPISGRDSLHLYVDEEQSASPANTYTATFDSTVYGGSYDFVSGKLTIEWVAVDMSSMNYIYNIEYSRFYSSDLSTLILKPSTNNELTTAICEIYKADTRNSLSNDNTFCIDTGGNLLIKDSRYTDINTYKTAMSGVYLCYPLATPTSITLTPEDIELLRGNDTIWADGDDVTVDYHYAAVESSFASGEATKIGMFGNQDLCEFIYTEDGLTPSASMTITTGFDFSTFEVDRILSIDVICCDTVSDTYESVQDERIYLTNTGDLHIDASAISNTMNVSVVIRFVKQ